MIVAAIFLIAVSAHASGGKIAYIDIQTVVNKTMLGINIRESCVDITKAAKRYWIWTPM